MTPAVVTFENHTPGDSWQGIAAIGPILVSVGGAAAVPMSSPIASARLHFKLGVNHPAVAKFSTAPGAGEGQIVLVNAATWELSIPITPPALFPLATLGMWYGHLEITDVDGTVWTTHEIRQPVGIDYTR